MSPGRAVGRRGGPGRAVGRLAWRAQDYAYVLARQAEGVLRRRPDELPRETGGAAGAAAPEAVAAAAGTAEAATAVVPVVLVPGVYEAWTFLRPLGRRLRAAGHPVHVLPTLGYNRGPIPDAARELGRFVAAEGLRGAVVVAHSKGGLIGKLAMLRDDPDGRIAGMVAVATPFGGSPYARWVPLRAVRAFVPTDATLVALTAERAVNARIVSVYSRFDPHIPGCCPLDGAAGNVELATPGHFRVLADPRLPDVVREWVPRLGAARAGGTVGPCPPSLSPPPGRTRPGPPSRPG